MRPGFFSVIVVHLTVAAVGVANAATTYPRHELWGGLGGGVSPEKNVFNVPGDLESHPEMLLSFGYIRNLDSRHAVGFHIFGGTETWPQGPGGTQPTTFELNTYNLGVRYRYTFSRGAFTPYAYAGISGAFGFIEGASADTLDYYGWSACAGPGVGIRLGRHFMLSAEGVGSYGAANWESNPLPNSSSRSFDPSLLGGTANLSFVWGGPPAPRPPAETPAVKDSSLASSTRAPTNILGNSPVQVVLNEALIVLFSSAAYADDRGNTLAGITAASALLGAAAGGEDLANPKSDWILFGGLVALAGGVLVMGHAGASNSALFATSVVSWNVIALTVNRLERNAGPPR